MLHVVPGVHRYDSDMGKIHGERIAFICKNGAPIKTVFVKDYAYDGDTMFGGGLVSRKRKSAEASLVKRNDTPFSIPKAAKTTDSSSAPSSSDSSNQSKLADAIEMLAPIPEEKLRELAYSISPDDYETVEVALQVIRSGNVDSIFKMTNGKEVAKFIGQLFSAVSTAPQNDVGGAAAGSLNSNSNYEETKHLELNPDDHLSFFPAYAKDTFQICVAGPTGVGKSGFSAQIARLYRDEHKIEWRDPRDHKKGRKHLIYIWAYAPNDTMYDGIDGVEWIKIADSLTTHPPDTDEFVDCFHIFDDIEKIRGEIGYTIRHFRDEVLQNGRKKHEPCISILHELFNGLESRCTINECGALVVFPGGNGHAINKVCRGKYEMDAEEARYVQTRRTRWVMIKRNHPRGLITPLEIRLW